MPTGTPATIWQPVSSTCWDNPLKREDVKRKIVGHWGTVPGQNFAAVKDLLDSSGVRYIYASEHNVFKRDARGYRCQIYRGMLDAIFAILFRNDPKDIEILQTW